MSLKDLENAIATQGEKLKLEAQKRISEIHLAQEELKRAIALEDSLRDKKLELARKIFGWSFEFAKSDVYKRIYTSAGTGAVHIYNNGWGHVIPHESGGGCWSRLAVKPDGTLSYLAGFKWAGGLTKEFSTPKDFAAQINHTYLSGLWNVIATEKIYAAIQEFHFGRRAR